MCIRDRADSTQVEATALGVGQTEREGQSLQEVLGEVGLSVVLQLAVPPIAHTGEVGCLLLRQPRATPAIANQTRDALGVEAAPPVPEQVTQGLSMVLCSTGRLDHRAHNG